MFKIIHETTQNKYILFINNTTYTFWVKDTNPTPYNKDFWTGSNIQSMNNCGWPEVTVQQMLKNVKDFPGFANLDY